MCGVITAAAITTGGGLIMANQQRQAAKGAMNAQNAMAQQGLDAQTTQFSALQELMAPWVKAGTGALIGQQDLTGLNGPEAQQKALAAIQASPQFQMMAQQGENAILQNASATGGLRGGNTQGALAQYRPMILSQLIDQQYQRLGGLSQMGQAGAAGQASAGMNYANNQSNLLGQMGANTAGGLLANSAANQNSMNSILQGFGMYGRAMDWTGFGGPGTRIFGGTPTTAGTPILGGTATGGGGITFPYQAGTLGGIR